MVAEDCVEEPLQSNIYELVKPRQFEGWLGTKQVEFLLHAGSSLSLMHKD